MVVPLKSSSTFHLHLYSEACSCPASPLANVNVMSFIRFQSALCVCLKALSQASGGYSSQRRVSALLLCQRPAGLAFSLPTQTPTSCAHILSLKPPRRDVLHPRVHSCYCQIIYSLLVIQ